MNKLILSQLVLICLVSLKLNAQDEKTSKSSKIQFSHVSIFYSGGSEKVHDGSIDEFRRLCPNSDILEQDFSGFTSTMSNVRHSFETYFLNLGFEFADKEKSKWRKNSEFRLGLNYSNRTNVIGRYEKLTLNNTNSSDIDTAIANYINMNTSSDYLQIDIGYLYKIIPESRISFYAGAGLTSGLLCYNNTLIQESTYNNYYSDVSSIESVQSFYHQGSQSRNKPGFTIALNTPLGLDFRIGKNDSFLKQFRLFTEVRPTAKVVTMPGIKPYSFVSMNYGFGIKFQRGC